MGGFRPGSPAAKREVAAEGAGVQRAAGGVGPGSNLTVGPDEGGQALWFGGGHPESAGRRLRRICPVLRGSEAWHLAEASLIRLRSWLLASCWCFALSRTGSSGKH